MNSRIQERSRIGMRERLGLGAKKTHDGLRAGQTAFERLGQVRLGQDGRMVFCQILPAFGHFTTPRVKPDIPGWLELTRFLWTVFLLDGYEKRGSMIDDSRYSFDSYV